MNSDTRWAAVGALGTIAATIVAFLAYAMPRVPVEDSPHPAPGTTASEQAERTMPSPTPPDATAPHSTSPETTPRPVRTTPRAPEAGPPLSLSRLSAPGCEEALTVVDRYYATAGSTEASQKAAATQAYQEMTRASTSAQGAVSSATLALARDFQDMRFVLEGWVLGDYAAAQARTNRDAQTLRDVCSAA